MGENKTAPKSGFGSSNGAGLSSAELQEKVALLRHLLKNVQKPVALSGLPTDQARLVSALQQEPLFFHSVAIIRPGEEASPAYLMGLLFHLLSISEQEVAASDPERLLNRHLTALEKKSQSLLLLVNDAGELKPEQRQQLVALSENYSAIHLVFLLATPVAESWCDDQFSLFPLSEFSVSSPNQQKQSALAAESRLFNIAKGVMALLLALMIVLIFLLPKGEEEFGRQVEVMALGEQPSVGMAEESSPVEESESSVIDKVVGRVVADDLKSGEADSAREALQPPAIEGVVEDVVVEAELASPAIALVEQVQDELLEVEKPVEPLIKVEKKRLLIEAVAPLPRISRKYEMPSGVHQEAWLLAQGKEKFSLQIMGGSEGASIANYIKKQQEKEQFAYYRVVKKGKNWYPLLYGLYRSKEAAKQAIKELPREYQKLKPWPRSLEAIQLEIRGAEAH